MTTHTRMTVKCDCGHVGAIRMSENDQPFSDQWECYTPEGLDGEQYSVEGFADINQVFKNMKLTCPVCKAGLTPSNMG